MISFKTRIIFVLVFLLNVHIYAQSTNPLNREMPRTPAEASLGNYGNTMVNLYKGAPTISLPIWNISKKGLSVPVSIDYDATGIRVNETPGALGTGWSINTAGKIWVDKRGKEYDRQMFMNNNERTIVSQRIVRDDVDPSLFTDLKCTDYEPDIFHFSFLGFSGDFVLDKKGVPVSYAKNKMKIAVEWGVEDKWTITDDNGIVYIFQDNEKSWYNRFMDDCNAVYFNEGSHTAWYLSEIFNPNTNFHIYFDYTTINTWQQLNQMDYISNVYFMDGMRYGNSTTFRDDYRINKALGKIIGSITTSDKEIEIKFDYNIKYIGSESSIVDEMKLSSISINSVLANSQKSLVKKYELTYDYHNQELGAKRLKLTTLQEYSALNEAGPSYVFDYDEATPLPPIQSCAIDYWGYYNGAKTNTTYIPSFKIYNPDFYVGGDDLKLTTQGGPSVHLIGYQPLMYEWGSLPMRLQHFPFWQITGANREPDVSNTFMKAGILKSIQYPTGGHTTFEFEPHDIGYVQDQSYILQGTTNTEISFMYGIEGYSKSTLKAANPNADPCNSPTYANPDCIFRPIDPKANEPVVPKYFTVNFKQPVKISCMYVANNDLAIGYIDPYGMCVSLEDNSNNVLWTKSFDAIEYSQYAVFSDDLKRIIDATEAKTKAIKLSKIVYLNPGEYTVKFDAGLANSKVIVSVDILMSDLETPINTKTIGGLRLKKITDYDGVDHKNDITKEYSYKIYDSNEKCTRSSGVLDHYPVHFTTFYSAVSTAKFDLSGSDLITSLNDIVGYRQVEELVNKRNKTVYNFTTLYEDPTNNTTNHFFDNSFKPQEHPYIPENKSARAGNLINKSTYKLLDNGTFSIIQEEKNEYNSLYSFPDAIIGSTSAFQSTIETDVPVNNISLSDAPFNVYLTRKYNVNLGFSWLENSKTILHTDAGNIEKTINYNAYDDYGQMPEYLLIKEVLTTQSDGSVSKTKYKYPTDYESISASSPLGKMLDNNMVNYVVEKQDWVGDNIVSSTFSNYNSNGSPKDIYQAELLKPISNTTFAGLDQTANLVSNSIYKPLINCKYDNCRNLTQFQKNFELPTSYIWGYKNTFLIAEVKNASLNQIYYEGFEENTSGVTFVDANNKNLAKTGKMVLSSYSYTFPTTLSLPSGNSYSMSYWYYKNNKWNFSNIVPYSSTISVTGAQKLDEIRVFPSNAQMTTYTYEPLVGMTSQTDANNVTTYFIYDNFARLKDIRDDKGNVLKHYEYNFKK